MTEFAGRIAVVTGGGSGMGRELVRQLVAEACNVAMCDVSPTGLAETQRLCEAAGLPQGLRLTTHIADVADRTQVERFRDGVADCDEAQVLTFHTKAWSSFAPPTCRMPLGQYQGIPRADPGGRVTPRF